MTTRERSAVPRQRTLPEQEEETAPAAIIALLREYDSLRQESLQAINNRILIMNFAFTSLAVITAAILTSSVSRSVVIPICMVFIPVSAMASLLIWLGEYNRSQRAGQGVAKIEKRINDRLDDPTLLDWESGLVSSGTHMSYPYAATAAYMLSVGVLALGLGNFYIGQLTYHHSVLLMSIALGCGVAYSVILETTFFRFFLKRWRDIRSYSHSQ